MRTTLDLDDDVLASAKEIAQRENKTAGQVLSALARQALTQGLHGAPGSRRGAGTAARMSAAAFGFIPFAPRGSVVTNELIRKLRDEADE